MSTDRLYFAVAESIKLVLNKQKSIQNAVYSNAYKNKKALLRLLCETLKYRVVFNEILKDKSVVPILSEPALKGDVNLIYALFYDFLIGPGLGRASANLKGAVLKRGKEIKDAEKLLAEENRGIESVKAEKNDDTIEIPRYARINSLKWSTQEAMKALEDEHWRVIRLKDGEKLRDRVKSMGNDEVLIDEDVADLLIFPKSSDFHEYWMVAQKYLILQDKASCLPAFLLNPPSGSHVFDCCAAPGMKTSHLAAIMRGKGKIWAMDRSKERVETMRQLLETSGIEIASVFCGDFLKTHVDDEKFGKVKYALVDPPCSGSGIYKRKDDLTGGNEKDSRRLEKLKNLQAMILKHALKFPKLQKAVYSTCSIHEEENEAVVEEVLSDPNISEHFKLAENVLPNWKDRGLKKYDFGKNCLRASPKNTLTNGFFVAVFERK